MPGKGDQIKGGFTGNTGGHSYQRTGCWPGEALRSATSQLSLLPGLFCRVGSIVLPFLFRDLRQLKPVQAPSTITRGLFNQSSRLPAMLTDYSLLCNGVPTSSPRYEMVLLTRPALASDNFNLPRKITMHPPPFSSWRRLLREQGQVNQRGVLPRRTVDML